MTTAPQQATSHTSRVTGYLLALAAGATWGTTGPLSTGLYRLMPATSIGFWRVLMGTVCLALWGLVFRRELFRVDGRGWLLVGVGGGFLVALFEIAYQFAIAGVGVAGAAALLRSEEHTSELQSRLHLVCRLLLEKKKTRGGPVCPVRGLRERALGWPPGDH